MAPLSASMTRFPVSRETLEDFRPSGEKRRRYANSEERELKERTSTSRIQEQRSGATRQARKQPKQEKRKSGPHTEKDRSKKTEEPATTPEGRGLQRGA
ncbi:hypothetical protein NDU88_006847 [Pleurodeles waltl]|uniref:Uncharacterized protein n=1 Tax=Pleurodeles waltl TaxID=8319 RepID=A0AAV7NUJ9_PLEWA|nr:hypothetical protein NDU88_006847 [Pleurodeles waltl]